MTQLLDLLLLAPDIQERVLSLEAVDGVEPMAERPLRSLVRHESWAKQRAELAILTDPPRSSLASTRNRQYAPGRMLSAERDV